MGVEASSVLSPPSAPATPEVSLIVPAYNEASTSTRADAFRGMLDDSLHMLARQFGARWEMTVLDDGSTDQTAAIAEEFGVPVARHADGLNHGKGASVRLGMLQARGDSRLFADADGAYSSETMLSLLSAVAEDGTDIAVAVRSTDGHQSLLRSAGHAALERICQHYAPTDSSDTQAGAKAFTADAAVEVWSRVETARFAADREAMHIAKLLGYRVADIPAEVKVVPGSHVRVVRDTLQIIHDTRAIQLRHKELEAAKVLTKTA